MRRLSSAVLALALAAGLQAPAQVPVQQLPYRGFSIVNQSDLEPALNRYAVTGYRLVAIASAPNGSVIAVMEKLPPESPLREYRVIFGGWAHLRGLHNEMPAEEQMNQAGAQGFRFFPGSILFSRGAAAAIIMERDPDPAARYAYRIFSPQLATSHRFEQDALRGVSDGFSVVFHGAAGRGPSTLMEKRTDSPGTPAQPSPSNRFLTITARDIAKRLQAQVDDGYVPLKNSTWVDFNSYQNSFWFQKSQSLDLRLVRHEVQFSPKRQVTADFAEEFTRKLNEAAAEGYRIAAPPIRIDYIKPAVLVHWIAHFSAVMQRNPGAAPVTYRYLAPMALPDLVSELNDAAAAGFSVVPGSLGRDGSIFVERPQLLSAGGAQ
ncbi:MAG TPA: hypothetical protein VGS02_18215 [Acidobacteriaceae bacterium]|nr:hypothetical protein [Acidobacteriaceae bacterium]